MIYKVSSEAAVDLENIWLYTVETWSEEQANRYLDLIFDEVEYLCLKPQSGIDFSLIRKGYFRSRVKSHFIFYKLNKKQNELEVIRILHQQMDIDNHLNK